jgi:hypothetical protein
LCVINQQTISIQIIYCFILYILHRNLKQDIQLKGLSSKQEMGLFSSYIHTYIHTYIHMYSFILGILFVSRVCDVGTRYFSMSTSTLPTTRLYVDTTYCLHTGQSEVPIGTLYCVPDDPDPA